MAGIVYFVLTIPEIMLTWWREVDGLDLTGTSFYIFTSLAVMVTTVIFYGGFVVLGQRLRLGLLTVSAYLIIAVTMPIYSYDLITIWWDLNRDLLPLLTLLTSGSSSIFFGIGLSRLESKLGTAAKTAAILELVTGICFLLIITSLIGLITLLPAVIAEILVLYKAYNLYRKPVGELSLGGA